MITDSNGNAVWQLDNSDPYGDNIPNQSPNGTSNQFIFNLRFPGQYYDLETGTLYNVNRDYDSATGRYIESDPRGLWGGSFSTYAYVNGNPLNRFDPFGLATVYYWGYQDNHNIGHVSMDLDDGTHISWWPTAGAAIGDSPAFPMPSLPRDSAAEGRPPDASIYVGGLDEAAIEKWWDDFKKTHNTWNFSGQNCSATIAQALDAGGGRNDEYPRGFPNPFIWAPYNVLDYANAINRSHDPEYTRASNSPAPTRLPGWN